MKLDEQRLILGTNRANRDQNALLVRPRADVVCWSTVRPTLPDASVAPMTATDAGRKNTSKGWRRARKMSWAGSTAGEGVAMRDSWRRQTKTARAKPG